MKRIALLALRPGLRLALPLCLPLALLGAPVPAAQDGQPQRISLSVRDADWKDVLRVALEHTDLNLSFDADIDTRVQGLDLKGVTLEELLDQILPGYNLGYVRNGRSLHIVKSDGGLRFYQVDNLAMRRSGNKDFSVTASGQMIQSTGGGSGGSGGGGSSSGGSSGGSGGSGSSSAYTSSLTTGNGSDPWRELQVGLTSLVFGDGAGGGDAQAAKTAGGPAPYALNKGGKVLLINPDSGVVTVGADAATQRRVERYLAELQRRNHRQILLEARIVEVTLNADSQIGVDWNSVLSPGAGTGGTGTSITGILASGLTNNQNVLPSNGLMSLVVQSSRVTATLSALASNGRLAVLSSPRIATLNNQKAILRVVEEQPYFLMSTQVTGVGSLTTSQSATTTITPIVVPVGIVLDIQPQIADNGSITLAVNPSVSEVVSIASMSNGTNSAPATAQATLPVVDRRDLDTVVHMQSGETLVLAGIIETKTTDTDRGVPWLRSIPILGDLFSKKEKSKTHIELAIFITATLVEDAQQIEAQRKFAADRMEKAGADLNPTPERKPAATLP